MSQVICLDGDHGATAAAAADVLALGRCPACPDTPLGTTSHTGVRVCPCCWSAWWSKDGAIACIPGAVVVNEPAVASALRA